MLLIFKQLLPTTAIKNAQKGEFLFDFGDKRVQDFQDRSKIKNHNCLISFCKMFEQTASNKITTQEHSFEGKTLGCVVLGKLESIFLNLKIDFV